MESACLKGCISPLSTEARLSVHLDGSPREAIGHMEKAEFSRPISLDGRHQVTVRVFLSSCSNYATSAVSNASEYSIGLTSHDTPRCDSFPLSTSRRAGYMLPGRRGMQSRRRFLRVIVARRRIAVFVANPDELEGIIVTRHQAHWPGHNDFDAKCVECAKSVRC